MVGRISIPGLMALALLASCGDATQSEESATRAEPEGNSHSPSGSTRQAGSLAFQPPPLSSVPLVRVVTAHQVEKATRAVLFSSSMGHLPYEIFNAAEDLGLLADNDSLSLTSDVHRVPEGLRWTQANMNVSEFSLAGAPEQRSVLSEMRLTLDGIPVHNAQIKMLNDDGNATWLTGSVPEWANQATRPLVTPFSLSENQAREALKSRLGFAEWLYKTIAKTFVPRSNEARASYLVTVSAEHRENDFGPAVPLEAALDADTGELLWQRPLAMHIEGTAQVYKENKAASSQLQAVPLSDIQVSGALVHSLFNVYNCQRKARHLDTDGTFCRAQATSSQNTFNFDYSDSRYDEVIAYAAISSAMNKFRSWDSQSLRSDLDQSRWPGSRSHFGLLPKNGQNTSSKQLNVFVNTQTKSATTNRCNSNTTPDNAQYLWAGIDGSGQPEILIGYGGYGEDCGTLKELGKDFDVVMHEFGHHAVFRGLSNTSSESVSLHEGFADYFTYAVSGNNLLAENSYPGRTALRQGNIVPGTTYFKFKRKSDGSYNTVRDYLAYPHLVGEFWSGILWEMRTALGKDASGSFKMDKIVWDSIDLLKSDGAISDGVSAISEATKRYADRFSDDAQALQSKIHDIFVKYEFAQIGSQGELVPTASMSTIATGTTKSKKVRWSCGELAATHAGQAGNSSHLAVMIATLLLAPLGLSQSGRIRKRERVRAQRKTDPRPRKN